MVKGHMAEDAKQELFGLVSDVGAHNDSDVVIYSGPLERPYDEDIMSVCRRTDKQKNVVLYIGTHGGDSHAAYRIARFLREYYERFVVYVHTLCKSAGTLLCLGANEIIMSDCSEMGPIDIQLLKTDELGERSSGLTITQAMATLQTEAFSMFEDHFLKLRFRSGFQISTKSAAEIAANITVGLFSPVYAQLDPVRIGEIDRAVRIAIEYGERIGKDNIKADSLSKLVAGYPDHAFVIDRAEAKDLFVNVREPTEAEFKLDNLLRSVVRGALSSNKTVVANLTKESAEKGDSDEPTRNGTSPEGQASEEQEVRTDNEGTDQTTS